MRFIILSLVTLFTYLLCVVFQGELQGQFGMIPSNFTEISLMRSSLKVISECCTSSMREHGMDCNIQAPEEEGCPLHRWVISEPCLGKSCLYLLPNISRNGQKCPKMQRNPGSYNRETWVSHVCDWHVYPSLDVFGKSQLFLISGFPRLVSACLWNLLTCLLWKIQCQQKCIVQGLCPPDLAKYLVIMCCTMPLTEGYE